MAGFAVQLGQFAGHGRSKRGVDWKIVAISIARMLTGRSKAINRESEIKNQYYCSVVEHSGSAFS